MKWNLKSKKNIYLLGFYNVPKAMNGDLNPLCVIRLVKNLDPMAQVVSTSSPSYQGRGRGLKSNTVHNFRDLINVRDF